MGLMSFGASANFDSNIPSPCVPLRSADDDPHIEFWSSSSPINYVTANDTPYAHNEVAQWGVASRAERDEAGFESSIEKLCSDALAEVRAAGFPHLLRMRNHFPGIHTQHADLDRHQRFYIGRQRAFDRHQVGSENELRAATMIGTQSGDITLNYLAARGAGEAFENPRQISAYRYSEQYGPASPASLRSLLKHRRDVTQLDSSGTASIVGHASRHQLPNEQLDEIACNLRALIIQASAESGIDFYLGQHAHLHVYARDSYDVPALRAPLQATLPTAPALFFVSDSCRRDLGIEVEAFIWSSPHV